ncbi:uracil-DNA glycosylase family protein [Stutzerimonas xanthomarina]|uniref:Uracil-DNA glycosylase, family 4 n=2 Tax=Stutzerimonas xanthomarina TaxID=271420 RepID=A0A1M5L566_9GAMM|nr:uracil-DNA glycosylase family protein [Stutzerimonas xanthomarina]MCP9340285.1 uracil-DNA glycosylase family protein [Stutzerimonas xanthomarina]SEH51070.1 uracil-DNA glycosylase, family 4 [Stutzerimonas xanthomarina]SHG60141.1 uracil-DNA glycosylase, family 4 [Stutzerimonas xanthomarina DSM 18231]
MKRPAPLDPSHRQAFRELAEQTEGIDEAVYRAFDKDPLEPIIGLGPADAPIAFFGRDPGREEVRHGEPFIGGGGQLVRRALYRHVHGEEMPDFEASQAIGDGFFWINTVPYKPLGNRAWSMAIKRRFHPLMRQLLLDHWQGRDVITLGREAFLWFGLEQPREVRQQLEAFWQREDRFTAHFDLELTEEAGIRRTFRLHPLPHPSPRNLTWFKRFPALLEARLQQLLD